MSAYYNEFDPYAAQWIRNLIAARLIPAGDVDERSITEVEASDLSSYSQCHFFAGIAGWALAARLAGWPDDRELWTGSPPCQPFSVAGKQRGQDDERHLWPHYFRLIRARRPAVAMGEQVAAAVGKAWLDGVLADLEGIGYTGRAVVVPACAVDAPHRRDRLWFVAERDGAVGHGVGAGLEGHAGNVVGSESGRNQQDRPVAQAGVCSLLADANGERRQIHTHTGGCAEGGGTRQVAGPSSACGGDVADADAAERRADVAGRHDAGGPRAGWTEVAGDAEQRSAWDRAGWIIGHDGKARRVEPGIRLLAHGVSARVGRLRAYGNAIVPSLAAEVIGAYLDCRP